MIIYFLRHASAGQSKTDPKKDNARALDKEGIGQCGLIGRCLSALDVHVDLVISSPLKRASQTAALVANELGHEGTLIFDPSLLPEASFEDFRKLVVKHHNRDAIMVVGHNPSMSEFVGQVIARRASATVELKKCAAAKVELDSKGGVLEWCITPKIVRAIHETSAASSRPRSSRK